MPLAGVLLTAAAERPAQAEVPAPQVASAAVLDVEAEARLESADRGGSLAGDEFKRQTETLQDLGSGHASYYGPGFEGNRTASGERFDPGDLTAAHPTLPFGSKVRVTDERTGKSVVVRINDRGPFHGGRIIDLSEAAARQIGLVSRGSGRVQLALLGD